jgi:6-phosphogluconolactonase
MSADGRFLYAANETGAADGTVSAFAIERKAAKAATLMPLNQVSSQGSAPCHLAIDKTGKWLAVANYASGSVAILKILPDGRLGEASAVDQHRGSSVNATRQKGPHAHSVVFSPDNRFLLSADLGLDKIFVYRFDPGAGSLAPADPPFATVAPGSGPRHLVFHPSGLAVYVVNELTDNVSVFRYDPANGSLDDAQTVPSLPPSRSAGGTAAEIAVNPSGEVLYVSSRGRDTVTRFAIDADRYLLTPLEATPMLGKTPRFFTFDRTGAFLVVANQDSDSLAVFRVHARTGELQPAGPLLTGIKQPSCLVFVK